MPIALADAQNYHPLMLTRQANPEQKVLEGEFTLSELRVQFDLDETFSEDRVLAQASEHGHAFLKNGDKYVGFAPTPIEPEASTIPDDETADDEVSDDKIDPDEVAADNEAANSEDEDEDEVADNVDF